MTDISSTIFAFHTRFMFIRSSSFLHIFSPRVNRCVLSKCVIWYRDVDDSEYLSCDQSTFLWERKKRMMFYILNKNIRENSFYLITL